MTPWQAYETEMARKGETVRRPIEGMSKVPVHTSNLKDELLMRRIDEENEKIRIKLEQQNK